LNLLYLRLSLIQRSPKFGQQSNFLFLLQHPQSLVVSLLIHRCLFMAHVAVATADGSLLAGEKTAAEPDGSMMAGVTSASEAVSIADVTKLGNSPAHVEGYFKRIGITFKE
jgi:hypothetical protein